MILINIFYSHKFLDSQKIRELFTKGYILRNSLHQLVLGLKDLNDGHSKGEHFVSKTALERKKIKIFCLLTMKIYICDTMTPEKVVAKKMSKNKNGTVSHFI